MFISYNTKNVPNHFILKHYSNSRKRTKHYVVSATFLKISYFLNGYEHRINGPASITYIDNKLYIERWYYKGNFHRIGGPAIVVYHKNGKIDTMWLTYGICSDNSVSEHEIRLMYILF